MSQHEPLTDAELVTLGALAQALVPEDETAGATVAWARDFVVRRVDAHPDEARWFRQLAGALDADARAAHGEGFDQLSGERREALLRRRHPSLAEDPRAAPEDREARRVMRTIIAAFLTSDRLNAADPFYLLTPPTGRDPGRPSDPDHSTAYFATDLSIDRSFATTIGTGDYARAWTAAGCWPVPGEPRETSELVGPPRRRTPA